uniref:Rad60-SLD_2 domain-containing protein n=1 Tax=Globodera pallida TaxID=36090 RepID=A0A183CG64_GLOPA
MVKDETVTAATTASAEKQPTNKISLKLILVSGRTHEFNQFTPSTSAAEICQHVFENWPTEWTEEKVSNASMLKLIYHGRFLHGSVSLGALNLPAGASSVMHLVTRETLPETNSNEDLKKSKSRTCFCCCIC